MVRNIRRLGAVCSFLFLSTPAMAGVIYTYSAANPVTPAGSLPATSENLLGLYPNIIFGNLGTDPNAVNVFAISILNPLDFSAITVNFGAFGVPDPELFLFNSAGRAVYANDDISAQNTLSCLPSADAANPCPSAAPGLGPVAIGTYYLAITRSNQLPVDASSNLIFAAAASTSVVGPASGPAGTDAVAGWNGGAFTNPNYDNSYYEISLTGTVPEPGTFLLLTGAGAFALLLRRRRAA